MRHTLPLLLILFLLAGCTRSPYKRGIAALEKDAAKAETLFWLAIAKNDSPADAHIQIALLHENRPEDIPFVIWNLQQAINYNPALKNDRVVPQWLQRLQDKLASSRSQEDANAQNADILSRLKHLEDFSLRQKKWIEDLTRENQLLRRAAAEAAAHAELP